MEVVREPDTEGGYVYLEPLREVRCLTHCGEIYYGSERYAGPHVHAVFEFSYLVSGTAWWQAGDTVFRHNQGELFFTPPGQPHQTARHAHAACHELLLGLRLGEPDRGGEQAARMLRALSHQGRQVLVDAREMEPILRGIVSQVAARRGGSDEVCTAYVQAFLGLVTQSVFEGVSSPGSADGRPLCYPVLQALAFMNHELHRRIGLEELARASGLSVSQLCFHFRRSLGLAPGAYHLRMRLNAAKDALLAPQTSVTRVAMEFGFSSSQHFAMDFRRLYGTSPQAWRRGSISGALAEGEGGLQTAAWLLASSLSPTGFCRGTRPDLPL